MPIEATDNLEITIIGAAFDDQTYEGSLRGKVTRSDVQLEVIQNGIVLPEVRVAAASGEFVIYTDFISGKNVFQISATTEDGQKATILHEITPGVNPAEIPTINSDPLSSGGAYWWLGPVVVIILILITLGTYRLVSTKYRLRLRWGSYVLGKINSQS